jgi:hypothetical protein
MGYKGVATGQSLIDIDFATGGLTGAGHPAEGFQCLAGSE